MLFPLRGLEPKLVTYQGIGMKGNELGLTGNRG